MLCVLCKTGIIRMIQRKRKAQFVCVKSIVSNQTIEMRDSDLCRPQYLIAESNAKDPPGIAEIKVFYDDGKVAECFPADVMDLHGAQW